MWIKIDNDYLFNTFVILFFLENYIFPMLSVVDYDIIDGLRMD